MPTIIAFSGKKSSGKNTCANFIFGAALAKEGMIKSYSINPEGKLLINNGNLVDFYLPTPEIEELLLNASSNIKIYACADFLKGILINMFGLRPEQVYGTDDEKNEPTEVRWDDIPGYLSQKEWEEISDKFKKTTPAELSDLKLLISPDREYLTGRELMEVLGTKIMRRMNPDVHIRSTLTSIYNDNPDIALITDIRFPNEVNAIQAIDGKVIRLTRNPFDSKTDPEVALDDFPLSRYDLVIDNQDLTIAETNKIILEQIL